MDTLNVQQQQITPTEIRSDPPSDGPVLNEISEMDFHRFVDTGISLTIKTPFVKTTDGALFAINLDGFLPSYQLNDSIIPGVSDNWFGPVMANMFPVQPFFESRNLVEIRYQWPGLPVVSKMMSNRIISGSVNVGIRIVSNVGQTGCFKITQGCAVQRRYFSNTETWNGMRLQNAGSSGDDFMPGGFMVFDISTNRNVSITTMRSESNRATDIMWKMNKIVNYPIVPTDVGTTVAEKRAAILKRNAISSQFLEDVLFFTPMTDFPATSATQFSMCFFFDYSKVTFAMPFYNMIPCPSSRGSNAILKYEESMSLKPVGSLIKTDMRYVGQTFSGLAEDLANIDVDLLVSVVPKIKDARNARDIALLYKAG